MAAKSDSHQEQFAKVQLPASAGEELIRHGSATLVAETERDRDALDLIVAIAKAAPPLMVVYVAKAAAADAAKRILESAWEWLRRRSADEHLVLELRRKGERTTLRVDVRADGTDTALRILAQAISSADVTAVTARDHDSRP